MTILGKMLVFLVLVLSLVWTWLTANAYVTRTNWRADAAFYQGEAKKAADSANEMKKVLDAQRDAAKAEKVALEASVGALVAQRNASQQNLAGLDKNYTAFMNTTSQISAKATEYQANVDKLQKQVDDLNALVNARETRVDELTKELGRQKEIAEQMTLDANAQRARADGLQERLQSMADQNRAGGRVPLPGSPTVAPLLDNFRGTIQTVEASGGDILVTLTPGLDAGLQRGSQLTVSRLKPSPLYVGRIVIISANPKSAVGKFLPPSNGRAAPQSGDILTPVQ